MAFTHFSYHLLAANHFNSFDIEASTKNCEQNERSLKIDVAMNRKVDALLSQMRKETVCRIYMMVGDML